MASKFLSWLDNVPKELKKFFTNPVVDDTIISGLGIAGLVDPALAPLFNGVAASITKAEALAEAANVQSGSGAQKLALAVADAQQAFQVYEQATNSKLESAQQTAIVNAIVALLNNIPAQNSTVTTPSTTPTPAPVSNASTGAAPQIVSSALSS